MFYSGYVSLNRTDNGARLDPSPTYGVNSG